MADGQLTGGDHALGLVPDVEQDLVLVDLDHRALDDVAVVELDDGAGDGILEGHAAEVVVDHLPGGVLTRLVEGAGLAWAAARRRRVSRAGEAVWSDMSWWPSFRTGGRRGALRSSSLAAGVAQPVPRQDLASAQESPQARLTSRGTESSAASRMASRVRAATACSSAGHLDDHLVVDLEDEPAGQPLVLQAPVEADQGHLEDVGGQALDAGVHGLALAGLAQPVVRDYSSGICRRRPKRVSV